MIYMWYTSDMKLLHISFLCQWQWISGKIIFYSHLIFAFVLKNVGPVVLVVVLPIVIVNKVSLSIPSFRIPHIIKTKSMFIQFCNFGFSFLLKFHFVTTCYSLITLDVQLFCWHTWVYCYLNFLLMICMVILYLLILYVTRYWFLFVRVIWRK